MVFPRLCEVCGTTLAYGEEIMCLSCLEMLPRCDIHNDTFNHIHQHLATHAKVERAAGLFRYNRHSPYAGLIKNAKYNGRPRIVRYLAEQFAGELAEDNFFDGIDLIIPVPMHRKKMLKRGFNQSQIIAEGIAHATGIAVGSNLATKRERVTQTRLHAFQRWQNASDAFEAVNPGKLKGRHILMVDDVFTTGATMAQCIETLQKAEPSVRVSILVLGVTMPD